MADKSIALDLNVLGQDFAQSRADVLSLPIEERKKRGLVTEKEFADYVIQQLDTTRSQESNFSPISQLETLPVDTDKLPDVAGQQNEQEFGSGIGGLLEYGYESSLYKRGVVDVVGRALGFGNEQATDDYAKTLDRKALWELATEGFSQAEQFKFLAVESRYPDDPGALLKLRDELLKEQMLGQYASRTSSPGFFASMILSPDTLLLVGLPLARGLGKIGNIAGDIGIGAATGAAYDAAHQGLGYQDFNMDRVGESALVGAALQGGIRGITEPFARTPKPINEPPPVVPPIADEVVAEPVAPVAEAPNLPVAATEPVVDANVAQQATQPAVAPESTIEATPAPVAPATPKNQPVFIGAPKPNQQGVLKPVAPPPSPNQIAAIAEAVTRENNHVAAVNYSDNAAAQMVHEKDSKWKGDFTASLNTELNNKLPNGGIVLPERFGKVQELLGKSQGASGIHDFITESLVNTPATPQDLNIISNVIEQRHTQAINAINERVVALNGLKDPEVIAQKRAEISRAKEWLLTTERFATQLKRDFPNHPFPDWVNKQSKEHTLLYQTIDGKKTVTKSVVVDGKLISPKKIVPSSDLAGTRESTTFHTELTRYYELVNGIDEGEFKAIVQPRNADNVLTQSRLDMRRNFDADIVTAPNRSQNWNNAPVLLRVLVDKQQAIDFGLTNLANKLGTDNHSILYLPIAGNGRIAVIHSILDPKSMNAAKASAYNDAVVRRGSDMASRYGMHNVYDSTTDGVGEHIYAQVLDLGSTDRPRKRKGETDAEFKQRSDTAEILRKQRSESQKQTVAEIAHFTNKPAQATLDALAVARADNALLPNQNAVDAVVEGLGDKNTLREKNSVAIAPKINMTGAKEVVHERLRNLIIYRSFGDGTLAQAVISETRFEEMIAGSKNKSLLRDYRNDLKQTANELFVESAKKTDNAVENAKTAGLDVVGGLTATFNKLLTETEKIAPENIDSIIDAISKQGELVNNGSVAQRAFEDRLLRNAVSREKTVSQIVNDTLDEFRDKPDMFSVPKRPEPPVAAKPPKKPATPEPVKPVEQVGERMPITHADKLEIVTARLQEEAGFINKQAAVVTEEIKSKIAENSIVNNATKGQKLIIMEEGNLYLVTKQKKGIEVDGNIIDSALNKIRAELGEKIFITSIKPIGRDKNTPNAIKLKVQSPDGFKGVLKVDINDLSAIAESEPGTMLDVTATRIGDDGYAVDIGGNQFVHLSLDQLAGLNLGNKRLKALEARLASEQRSTLQLTEEQTANLKLSKEQLADLELPEYTGKAYRYTLGVLEKEGDYRIISPSAVKNDFFESGLFAKLCEGAVK